jgi:hypothetical protein
VKIMRTMVGKTGQIKISSDQIRLEHSSMHEQVEVT